MSNNIEMPVWLSQKFKEYYSKNFIEIDQIEKREFGFGTYDKKIEYRHVSFSSNKDFNTKLAQDGPLYVSYSAAYYASPAARPMQKKEWLGADLVFDLDAHQDSILISPEELEKLKSKLFLLIDILENDFGISKTKIKINFSGSRGFHLRVFDEDFKTLGRYARKEIVDYIDAIGLDLSKFFYIENKNIVGPKLSDWGYSGKLASTLYSILSDESKASKYFGKALELEKFKQKYLDGLKNGNWTFLAAKLSKSPTLNLSNAAKNLIEKLQLILEREGPNIFSKVDTDANVTVDTSKLLRAENTLHGGSGLIAKTIFDLAGFEPLKDSLAFSMKKTLTVQVLSDIPAYEFGNMSFEKLEKQKKVELPEAYAIYLACKKLVLVVE
ncbi:MAG: DNA primase catalytic subunit PriS [Candidatus Micrarchaeota archaeon]|nr:DNA primase catalytic subunit PriS [Candidatus Micrarchaeota archaeon]